MIVQQKQAEAIMKPEVLPTIIVAPKKGKIMVDDR